MLMDRTLWDFVKVDILLLVKIWIPSYNLILKFKCFFGFY